MTSDMSSSHLSGGSTRMLIKAETPRSAAQKSNFFDKDHVLNTVMGILNPPTVTKFDLLKRQLIASAITNADTLKDVVSLIFNSAVLEPTFCPMYAQLFSDLSENLPPFPSDEPGGRKISFKRVLLNNCQEAFEGADKLRDEVRQMIAPEQESEHKDIEKFVKLRNLGNIKLIGELFNIRMVTESIVRRIVQELLEQDPKSCPEEEKVEAICQSFNIIGKQLDENNNSRSVNDVYFNRLKQLSTNPQLVPRLRFMVSDVMDLRSNNWVPRREEVKAKSIAEFHSKAQKTLSSRPGASARMRNCRGPPAQGSSRYMNACSVNSIYFGVLRLGIKTIVAIISDHVFKIKQEVEAELFGEDASRGHVNTSTTQDSRFEGHERVRYTLGQLLQLKGDILKLKQEVEAELFGEDSNQDHADNNVQCQSKSRFSEPDTDDCCSKSAQLSAPVVDISLEPLRVKREDGDRFYSSRQVANEYNVQEQLSSHLARTQTSPNQADGPPNTLIKAELPCSSARGTNLSDKYRVLKTVKGILNNPTLEKFNLLKSQQIISAITSTDTLKDVISMIFLNAVLEPTFCPKYAQLCADLNLKLPSFPSNEPGGESTTFKCVLWNNCQEAVEVDYKLRAEVRRMMMAPEQESARNDKEKLIKLRAHGNARLIGELYKQNMIPKWIIHDIVLQLLGQNPGSCPPEENVEAICWLFNNIGKLLDERQDSRNINDLYFGCLKRLSTNPQLAPRLKLMVCDLLDLRANNWIPKPIFSFGPRSENC
ncbi:Eukaryotic translation initiation factor isoform 4G-2 [Capsicum chinense]|nr:Eukaryotic translation initiation factor isoform 4G-2 [Capsicum chinense]